MFCQTTTTTTTQQQQQQQQQQHTMATYQQRIGLLSAFATALAR